MSGQGRGRSNGVHHEIKSGHDDKRRDQGQASLAVRRAACGVGRVGACLWSRHWRRAAATARRDSPIHAESPTTGGRNTASQIACDAKNLGVAAQRDTAALRANAINQGADPAAVDTAVKQLHKANRKAGRY